jgi:hypothetical protein
MYDCRRAIYGFLIWVTAEVVVAIMSTDRAAGPGMPEVDRIRRTTGGAKSWPAPRAALTAETRDIYRDYRGVTTGVYPPAKAAGHTW